MAIQNNQKRLIQNILYLTGLLFAVFGVFILSSPIGIAALLFENDTSLAQIFGGVLVLAGVADVVIAKTVFNFRDRK